MHTEQSKLSLNAPRKAAEECWQTLLGSGDLEASIFIFQIGAFVKLLPAAERCQA